MGDTFKIALVQFNPHVGDVVGNAVYMLKTLRDLQHRVDLLVFPELALTGYSPEDMMQTPAFRHACNNALTSLIAATHGLKCAAIIPAPTPQGVIETYNSAYVVRDGDIIETIHKHHLPNYRVFDERRIFIPGTLHQPCVTIDGVRVGLVICEDFWFPDVIGDRAQQDADVIISVNASPLEDDKFGRRMATAEARVHETGLPLLYLNSTGGQDEVVFDGASFALDGTGRMVARAAAFNDDVLFITLKRDADRVTVQQGDVAPYPARDELLYTAACTGLRDYVDKNGFPGVLIGLSGGIDSALSAAMAVDALGSLRVKTVMMPSPFTSAESLADAQAMAKALKVDYQIIPITDAMGAYEKTIPNLSGLAHENMQSRVRGTILMSLSNQTGFMVLTTGNKSENAVGYATLYGDMCGGYNAIKDLYKVDVYALARYRNAIAPVIPDRVLTRAPSAELRDNQTDQDSLPPYEVLDRILRGLIELNRAPDDLIKAGEDAKTVAKIVTLLRRSEYKRRQAAPGAKLGSRAFGRDWRMPMTNKFKG